MLSGVPVAHLMRPNPPAVTPDTPLSKLVYDHVMGTDESAFPVVEGDQLLGIVCLDDVRKVPRAAWDTSLVRQIMTPIDQLEVVTPQEAASEALLKLARRDVRQIPVVENGRLVGMLRRQDIIRWLQLQSDHDAPGIHVMPANR